MPYPIRIECGNCFSRANYEIERGVVCNDADLVCPNCGCSPTDAPFAVMKDNCLAKHTVKKEDPSEVKT